MFFNFRSLKNIISRKTPQRIGDSSADRFDIGERISLLQSSEPVDTSLTFKRVLLTVLSLIFVLLLQEAVFNDLRVFSVKPDLVLAFLTVYASLSGNVYSLFTGLFAGLTVDIAFGRYMGFYALFYMLFCTLVSAVASLDLRGKFLYHFLSGPGFIMIFNMAFSLGARFMTVYATGRGVLYENYGRHFLCRILPASIYTSIIYVIVFLPVVLLWKKAGPSSAAKSVIFRGR